MAKEFKKEIKIEKKEEEIKIVKIVKNDNVIQDPNKSLAHEVK